MYSAHPLPHVIWYFQEERGHEHTLTRERGKKEAGREGGREEGRVGETKEGEREGGGEEGREGGREMGRNEALQKNNLHFLGGKNSHLC